MQCCRMGNFIVLNRLNREIRKQYDPDLKVLNDMTKLKSIFFIYLLLKRFCFVQVYFFTVAIFLLYRYMRVYNVEY